MFDRDHWILRKISCFSILYCNECLFLYWFIDNGNGTPLQYSCLENPRDRGAWWAAVYGVTQSRTRLKRLSSSSSIDNVEILLECHMQFGMDSLCHHLYDTNSHFDDVKGLQVLRTNKQAFRSVLIHMPSLCPLGSCLTSLSLSFLKPRVRMLIPYWHGFFGKVWEYVKHPICWNPL